MDKPQETTQRNDLYDKRNDTIRIDCFQEIDDHLQVALRTFCRHIEVPHLFDERIAPTMKTGDSHLFAAVRDRPWPPWGLGSRKISALCMVHPIGKDSFGLSPIHMGPEDDTNIGLIAALLKEVLEHVAAVPGGEINYLVINGSVLASRVLRSHGFKQAKDVVITDRARYHFFRAEAKHLLVSLGLDKIASAALLAGDFPMPTLEKTALFPARSPSQRLSHTFRISSSARSSRSTAGCSTPPCRAALRRRPTPSGPAGFPGPAVINPGVVINPVDVAGGGGGGG